MPIKIYDDKLALHEAAPKVYGGYWRDAVAWVFSGGTWRRTYDPVDENLVTNSRMLNGSDYFTYIDGTVIGTPPPGWSAFSNAPSAGGNAYATYANSDLEYSRSYTFKAAQSRMFFQARIYVRQGETYNASAMIKRINLQVGRKSLDIYADGVPADRQSEYVQIITPFPTVPELVANTRAQCVFKALKDCLVQFNIGVGVDYNDSGDIQIQAPQVTKSSALLSYQATPRTVTYNAVLLDNSWMQFDHTLNLDQGTHHVESSVVMADDASDITMLLSRSDDLKTTGIGYSKSKHSMFVMSDGVIVAESEVVGSLPSNIVFGFGLWFDVSGGYVSNIRFHVNGKLVSRIKQVQPIVGSFDSIFGSKFYKTKGVTVEQFALYFNQTNYLFNLEEGSGNISRESVLGRLEPWFVTMAGIDDTDFRWIGKLLPQIITQPDPTYIGTMGANLNIPTTAAEWDKVQWRTQYGPIEGATDPVLVVVIGRTYDYGLTYHAEYSNRFGTVQTNTTRIVSSTTNLMATQSGRLMGTEEGNNITP